MHRIADGGGRDAGSHALQSPCRAYHWHSYERYHPTHRYYEYDGIIMTTTANGTDCNHDALSLSPRAEGDSAIRADYDVLLLQASDNHIERDLPGILPAGAKPLESHPAVTTLRWTAEKKYDPMSYPSSCTHRLTPLKLTSSPSQCLMKYVLGGKPVKLASTGSSTITHLLSEHNGIVVREPTRTSTFQYRSARSPPFPTRIRHFYLCVSLSCGSAR